ncbi:MAG: DUF3761 domain-containing protein [Leifsonia sp.]
MTTPPPTDPRSGVGPLRKVPVTTWIGIGCTALLALIGLASGGVWMMIFLAALVVLPTAIYGWAFRRPTWLRLPRKRAVGGIGAAIAFVILLGSSGAYGATHPETSTPAGVTHGVVSSSTPTPSATPTPVITTKVVAETAVIPFTSTTVDSATVPQGTSSITTAGANGVETKTYLVTYSDGVETTRVLQSDVVTTPPVAQVTTVGTYVAPPPPPAPAAPTCTNGTYVNSAGNTVCRPETSAGAPPGATAKCNDGTYSFSQTRRGTCSSHGGVAEWL